MWSTGGVKAPENIYTLPLLKIIKETQQQHGLRHGDYQRYRTYCSRRLQRLRKVLNFVQGDRKNFKKKVRMEEESIISAYFIFLLLIFYLSSVS